MSVFVVIEARPDPVLATNLLAKYPTEHFKIADGQWLIASSETTLQVSESLGLAKGSGLGSTAVFQISNYYGLHSSDLWDWLKTKFEGG